MKTTNKTNTALCGLLSGLLLLAAVAAQTHAAITLTNTTNITLAASQTEAGGDTSPNPDVTGGLGGPLLNYTGTTLTAFPVNQYDATKLNNGDIGAGGE